VRGSLREGLVIALMGVGCADVEAPVGLSYGTLTEDHVAARSRGCTADRQIRNVLQGDVVLSSSMPGVSRELLADEGKVRFDFAAEPVVAEGGATLTLTATARTEATYCGTGCSGSEATARFSWRGLVTLPSSRSYSVRVMVDAYRETDISPVRFGGECLVETPWRSPIVVESGRQSRVVDASAGAATIALNCRPIADRAFAQVSCFGAEIEGAPSRSNTPATVDARLTVRFVFTPKA
jgi:hypothetical protein